MRLLLVGAFFICDDKLIMRFIPFRLNEYPHIARDLESVEMDLSIAKLGKNAIRLPNRIIFIASFADGTKQVEVPLDEEGYRTANLSIQEKICLRRILDLLEKTDIADMQILERRFNSQFEISNAIRKFDQNFGGARFISLAAELIDRHMGVCLYPYMAPDLALSVYLAYNKNVNRDVEGFMSAIVDFIDEFVQNEADLQPLFANIQDKSSEKLFVTFFEFAVKKPRLANPLLRVVTDLFSNYYGHRVNNAGSIPPEAIAKFPKEYLISFFETVDPLFGNVVASVLDQFGSDCDPDYLYAYQRNPSYDTRLLASNPAFVKLDSKVVRDLKMREWVSKQTEGYEIVKCYCGLQQPEERESFLRILRESGWNNLANALIGDAFSARGMDASTLFALLPLINLENEHNRQQTVSCLRTLIEYGAIGYEKQLLKLHHEAFAGIIRDALSNNKIRDIKVQLVLADRYRCADALNLKEWH